MPLIAGEAAPSFTAPALNGNSKYGFDTAAGRAALLLFAGSAAHASSAEAIKVVQQNRDILDDVRACFFGISIDPSDAEKGRISQQLPGIRWFLDYDVSVSRLFRAADDKNNYLPHWVLLDQNFRVVEVGRVSDGARMFDRLRQLIAEPLDALFAPVLVVPRIFEPDMCRGLIQLYEDNGGRTSGFMREIDGVTKGIYDDSFKRRSDYTIKDEALQEQLRARIRRCLLPQISRAFQFRVTRIERYIVACYEDEGPGGFFRPHRDNTTAGTAHRRFACTINLNAGEYEGGNLRFPEYGPRQYCAPTGGAIVFSCSLLHEALPVTKGKRYAYLPFLYDEAAAKQREANTNKVSPELADYRA